MSGSGIVLEMDRCAFREKQQNWYQNDRQDYSDKEFHWGGGHTAKDRLDGVAGRRGPRSLG